MFRSVIAALWARLRFAGPDAPLAGRLVVIRLSSGPSGRGRVVDWDCDEFGRHYLVLVTEAGPGLGQLLGRRGAIWAHEGELVPAPRRSGRALRASGPWRIAMLAVCWLMWIGGTVLIVASWFRVVPVP